MNVIPAWHQAVLDMDHITGPTSFLCAPQAYRNIEGQAAVASSFGSHVVPHFKGHRLQPLAEHQLATGSPTIEASMMTDIIQLYRNGLDCSFTLSWCWDRPPTWEAAAALVSDGATVTVDVDSLALAEGYALAAASRDVTLGVRVQVHSGLRGIEPSRAIELARTVASAPNLRLEALTAYRGIYTAEGSFNRRSPDELGREEGELLAGIAAELADDVDELSVICGSTLTSAGAASIPAVTGAAAGTYAIADLNLALLGFCPMSSVAIATLVTVVETDGDVASVNAGTRHLGTFSHYPSDMPGLKHSATLDGDIELIDADATSGRLRRVSGPPLVAGQRVLLLPGNASAFAKELGAVMVVDDQGTITDSWARVTNEMKIDDVLI